MFGIEYNKYDNLKKAYDKLLNDYLNSTQKFKELSIEYDNYIKFLKNKQRHLTWRNSR